MLGCVCPQYSSTKNSAAHLSGPNLHCALQEPLQAPIALSEAGARRALYVLLACCSLTLVWWLCLAIPALRQWRPIAFFIRWKSSFSKCFQAAPEDPEHKKALALLKRRREELTQAAVSLFFWVFPFFLIAQIKQFLDCFQSADVATEGYQAIFGNGNVDTLINFAFLLLAKTTRREQAVFGVCGVVATLMACAHIPFYNNDLEYFSAMVTVQIVGVAAAVLLNDAKIVLAIVGSFCSASIFFAFTLEALQPHAVQITVGLCTFIAISTGLAWMIRRSQYAEAQAIVREQEASISTATCKSLLALMCDAVFTLGSDFCLKEDCPQLGALLLRQSKRNLAGQEFQALLQPQDRERFAAFVVQAFVPGRARSLHVHLLDACHTSVPVQLFHAAFEDSEKTVNHLFGVLEDGDHCRPVPASRAVPAASDQALSDLGAVSNESREEADADAESVGGHSATSRRSSVASIGANSSASASQASQGAVASWGLNPIRTSLQTETRAMVKVRLPMQFHVLQETAPSRALFGFTMHSEQDFTAFVKDADSVRAKLLSYIFNKLHIGWFELGSVVIENPSSGVDYQALLEVRKCRGLLAEEVEDIELWIHVRPPKSTASSKSPRRRPRSAQALNVFRQFSAEADAARPADDQDLPGLADRGTVRRLSNL